jgi:ABC-type lipoprotein release transport system permease subunit
MLTLAWRSIWRNRSRSIGAAFAVGFTVFMGLAYFGIVNAYRDGMYVNLTDTVGHVQIHVRGYRDIRDFREAVIPDASAMRPRIERALPGTTVAAALDVPALLSGEDRARGVLLSGLAQPPALRDRFAAKYVRDGRLPSAEDLEGIAIGGALARTLKVKLGDTVYAYAPGTDGTGASAYVVVGILHFPDPAQDARGALLSLPAAQELAAPGAVSRFELHFPELRHTTDDAALFPLRIRLQDALGADVVVETWRETYPSLSNLERMMRPLVIFFIGLFFVLAGLLVVNTIYLSVIERTRELGVVVALGARRGRVMRMVLAESFLLCRTGAAVGLITGFALIWRLAQGFAYPGSWGDVTEAYGLPRVMYASVGTADIVIMIAFVIGIGMLAALWPARVAGRLAPVEAMRFAA